MCKTCAAALISPSSSFSFWIFASSSSSADRPEESGTVAFLRSEGLWDLRRSCTCSSVARSAAQLHQPLSLASTHCSLLHEPSMARLPARMFMPRARLCFLPLMWSNQEMESWPNVSKSLHVMRINLRLSSP